MMITRPEDDRFRAAAEKLASWTSERYENPAPGVDLTEAAPYIDAIRQLGKFVGALPVEAATANKIQQATQGLEQINTALGGFNAFSDVTKQAEYEVVVKSCTNAYHSFVDQKILSLFPLVLIGGLLESRLSELDATLKSSRNKLVADQNELATFSEKSRQAVAEIIGKAKERASEIAVASHQSSFAKRACRARKASVRWLRGAGLLGASAFVLAAIFAYYLQAPEGNASALSLLGGKALLVGLLVSAAYWCGRNYRALQHQATVNEAKADALATFEIFHQGAATDDVKDAVLLETTRSIFSTAETGFLAGGSDGSSIINEFYNRPGSPPS